MKEKEEEEAQAMLKNRTLIATEALHRYLLQNTVAITYCNRVLYR